MNWIKNGDFTISKQDREFMINNIKRFTFREQDGWSITNHMIGDFPREGSYKVDKHSAWVFGIPTGMCEILSLDAENTKECWAPISNVTYHTGADCVRMFVHGNKYIETTANESVAVFDYANGGIKKVSPLDCTKYDLIPVFGSDNNSDYVPITTAERNLLNQHGAKLINKLVTRSQLLDYLSYLDEDSPLFKRINNTDICWEQITKLEPMGKQEVFDFEVEGTKTFFVNDGILTYDTVSNDGIISREANEEVDEYLNSPARYVRTNGTLYMGYSDLQKLTFANMTRDPD